MLSYWPFFALLGLVFMLHLVERARPAAVTRFEEMVISLLLGAMTIVSFSQVVARYGFNSGWTGALDLTRILFAWLILFGMGYGLKTQLHLGVDAAIRMLPRPLFRACALAGAVATLLYAMILLSADWLALFGVDARGGAIFYWQRFFNAGLGLENLRWPDWLAETFGLQERVPRWIAYLMLPIGLALLAYRALEATWAIAAGRRELAIASHEAEELVAQNRLED